MTDQEKDIYLTITIGNAQIGGNVIKWKGSTDIIGKGEISNLNLGKGITIKEKILEITTNILDVNQSNNGVVATYYFHNATAPSVTFDEAVNSHGDVFSLELDVNFK
ncbi:hypothetical protein CLU83_2086 [Flavobacterium sp. 1]|uniref:hypothetical protein n=1 Tax=Flavobacterium sp. 1 TaxID=2035200 RepID=UPI000C23208C|nr:hypothetical protein [Flavobacterium sp. 1]PJJ08785.1 hypothetical protein CLU83_2086 [Flavobacterium sp. 1]